MTYNYRADLLPPHALIAISEVLHHGAEKYGVYNWERIETHDHINHAVIHILNYLRGDTSEFHLANAATRLLFALDLEIQKEEFNVRVMPANAYITKPTGHPSDAMLLD